MNKKLKHEIWSGIQMEKIPEFKIIEKKIDNINMLSKKENINLLEKLNCNYPDEFLEKLENSLFNNKIFKPFNAFDDKKNLLSQKTRAFKMEKNMKLRQVESKEKKHNALPVKFNSQNFVVEKRFDKLENKENPDLMHPQKGNFSFSLKYYNNNEFLTFINKKFKKDVTTINEILQTSKKLIDKNDEVNKKNSSLNKKGLIKLNNHDKNYISDEMTEYFHNKENFLRRTLSSKNTVKNIKLDLKDQELKERRKNLIEKNTIGSSSKKKIDFDNQNLGSFGKIKNVNSEKKDFSNKKEEEIAGNIYTQGKIQNVKKNLFKNQSKQINFFLDKLEKNEVKTESPIRKKQIKKGKHEKHQYLKAVLLLSKEIESTNELKDENRRRIASANLISTENKIKESFHDLSKINFDPNNNKGKFKKPLLYLSEKNFLNNMKNCNLKYDNFTKTDRLFFSNKKEKGNLKLNHDYNNLDLSDLIMNNDNQELIKTKPNNIFTSRNENKRINHNDLFSKSDEKTDKLFKQAQRIEEKLKKTKKLTKVIDKIRRMNNIFDDEKHSQITPFIRTNVFCDDLNYEQVFRGIKTFELSHAKSKFRKNLRKEDKVFKPHSTELRLVKKCNRKIRVYSKSLKRKIRNQDFLNLKALLVKKKAAEGGDYIFKKQIRSETLTFQSKRGMFIYSNGKGYNTQNYERLYSTKFTVNEKN